VEGQGGGVLGPLAGVLEDLSGGGGAPDIHRIAPFIVGVFVVLLYKIGREVSRVGDIQKKGGILGILSIYGMVRT
jgi:hypothetical protein